MASDHDDPEVVIKAEKSSDELREERRQAAERDGDVLDVRFFRRGSRLASFLRAF